jgi:hypothetical protein
MSMNEIPRRIERIIAKRTIAAVLYAGFDITVFNGETDEVKNSRDPDTILKAMFTTDEDYLMLNCKGANSFKGSGHRPSVSEGWIKFVYGNEGWDVINDYTTNLEKIMDPINKFADGLS